MSMNPLAGKRAAWLRQYSDTSEGTTEAIAATLRLYGYDALVLKCAHGPRWQMFFDPATPVDSGTDAQALQREYARHGITMVPVVVPTGADLAQELAMAVSLANFCGAVVVDIEAGPRYWAAPTASLMHYWQALRESTDGYLISQPDGRLEHWAEVLLAETAQYVDAFCPQFYAGYDAMYSAFVATTAFNAIATRGKPVGATLWGLGDLGTASDCWRQMRGRAFGYQVFSFGAMNAGQLAWGGMLPVGDGAPCPPHPRLRDLLDLVTVQAKALDAGAAVAAVQAETLREAVDWFR